jgi:uncharacterized protein (TIGR02996 family)
MSLEEAFLRDVIANPDDDAPRLVFADWLEEHGQAKRAEFIRLQCRMARLGEEDPERDSLLERSEELLEEHLEQFLGPLAPLLQEGTSTDPDRVLRFRRGFVEVVQLPLQAFARHAGELFARTPVRVLWLSRDFNFVHLMHLSGQEQIRQYVEQMRRLSPADLEALAFMAACPQMTRVASLGLQTVILVGEGMRILAGSRYLTGLGTKGPLRWPAHRTSPTWLRLTSTKTRLVPPGRMPWRPPRGCPTCDFSTWSTTPLVRKGRGPWPPRPT